MNKETIIRYFQKPHVRDYSYTIAFFIVFSILTFFIIRPNIVTVVRLQKEHSTLLEIKKGYDLVIGRILTTQSELEQVRSGLMVLSQALPQDPTINTLINDIKMSAESNETEIVRINIGEISLKKDAKKERLKEVQVQLEVMGTYNNIGSFITSLMKQRRLKTIKTIQFNPEELVSSTGSAQLKVQLMLLGYYL